MNFMLERDLSNQLKKTGTMSKERRRVWHPREHILAIQGSPPCINNHNGGVSASR